MTEEIKTYDCIGPVNYGDTLEYQLIRSDRRKEVEHKVTHNADLIVRAPRDISDSDIERYIRDKEDWIYDEVTAQEFIFGSRRKLTGDELCFCAFGARLAIPTITLQLQTLIGVTCSCLEFGLSPDMLGSCSEDGEIFYNCLMMYAPKKVWSYILIHELCHMKYMDHGKGFWKEVARYMPDYDICVDWINKNFGPLADRLPKRLSADVDSSFRKIFES